MKPVLQDTELLRRAAAGDPIAMLRALVATDSVNPRLEPTGPGEASVAALVAGWLEGWGLDVQVEEVEAGRCNVVARLGSVPAPVLLNGHLDTVGVRGMTVPPFDAFESEGRIHGRGAADMKGGVAAILAAVHRAAKAPRPPSVLVALTADEEHASIGMERLISGGLAREARMAVVTEPTGLAVMPAHKGFLWVTLETVGRAAHGSRPDQGVDAIRAAGLFLSELEGYWVELRSRPPHPLLGHASFHAGTIEGGDGPSVYPAHCRLVVERRTLPGETAEAVFSEFETVLEGLKARGELEGARLEAGLFRAGSEVAAEGEVVGRLMDAMEATGVVGGLEGMTAWVEAGMLNEAGLPAVCFGPGDIEAAHTADESIPISEVLAATDVLERVIRS